MIKQVEFRYACAIWSISHVLCVCVCVLEGLKNFPPRGGSTSLNPSEHSDALICIPSSKCLTTLWKINLQLWPLGPLCPQHLATSNESHFTQYVLWEPGGLHLRHLLSQAMMPPLLLLELTAWKFWLVNWAEDRLGRWCLTPLSLSHHPSGVMKAVIFFPFLS